MLNDVMKEKTAAAMAGLQAVVDELQAAAEALQGTRAGTGPMIDMSAVEQAPAAPPLRAQILMIAKDLTTGSRNQQHGEPLPNHLNIAQMWNAYLRDPQTGGMRLISAHDVMLMVALLKIARTKSGSANLDDYVDAAAYLAMAGEVMMDAQPKPDPREGKPDPIADTLRAVPSDTSVGG